MLIMLLVLKYNCDIPKVYAAQITAQLLSGTQPMSDLSLVFLQCQLNSFYMLAKVVICWLAGRDILEVNRVVLVRGWERW